jgi:hypothetical protein
MTTGEALQTTAGLCLLWFSSYMTHQNKDDRRRKQWKNIIAIIMLVYSAVHAVEECYKPDPTPRNAALNAPATE